MPTLAATYLASRRFHLAFEPRQQPIPPHTLEICEVLFADSIAQGSEGSLGELWEMALHLTVERTL